MNSDKQLKESELQLINTTDDLKIAPLRRDGITYGTPTWIWNVVVENELYVRAYNGKKSSWYQSAITQGVGKIYAAGMEKKVRYIAVDDDGLNTKIDEAYKTKYKGSPYLQWMINDQTKAATIHIIEE